MNTGGRRRPLGPLLSGLTCCALLISALSLSLGAGAPHSPVDAAKVTTITHAVSTAHLVSRPASPDQLATPVVIAALVLTFGFVLIVRRRVVPHAVYQGRRPSDRAPPSSFPRD